MQPNPSPIAWLQSIPEGQRVTVFQLFDRLVGDAQEALDDNAAGELGGQQQPQASKGPCEAEQISTETTERAIGERQ